MSSQNYTPEELERDPTLALKLELIQDGTVSPDIFEQPSPYDDLNSSPDVTEYRIPPDVAAAIDPSTQQPSIQQQPSLAPLSPQAIRQLKQQTAVAPAAAPATPATPATPAEPDFSKMSHDELRDYGLKNYGVDIGEGTGTIANTGKSIARGISGVASTTLKGTAVTGELIRTAGDTAEKNRAKQVLDNFDLIDAMDGEPFNPEILRKQVRPFDPKMDNEAAVIEDYRQLSQNPLISPEQKQQMKQAMRQEYQGRAERAEDDILNNPAYKMDIYKAGQSIEAATDKYLPQSKEDQERLSGVIGSGLGSAAGYVLLAALNAPAAVYSGVTGIMGDQYTDAAQSGADTDQARTAALQASPLGLIEYLPAGLVVRVFKRSGLAHGAAQGATKALREGNVALLREYLKGVTEAGLAEATEEIIQQFGQNYIAKEGVGYDKERSLTEGVVPSGIGGGAAGGILGGAGVFAGRRARRGKHPLQESELPVNNEQADSNVAQPPVLSTGPTLDVNGPIITEDQLRERGLITPGMPKVELPEVNPDAIQPAPAPVAEPSTPVDTSNTAENIESPIVTQQEIDDLINDRQPDPVLDEVTTEPSQPVGPQLIDAMDSEGNKIGEAYYEEDTGYLEPITEERGFEDIMKSRKPVKAETSQDVQYAGVRAATSPFNETPQPTQAQKEAGNYKKGHINLQGLNISIENPRHSKRTGVDADGKPWSVEMQYDYGYIKGTKGKDGDHIDTFIGDNPQSSSVYIIDTKDPKTGKFDEHKVFIGFDSQDDAEVAFAKAYPGVAVEHFMGATEMQMPQFKRWVNSGRKMRPVSRQPASPSNETEFGYSQKPEQLVTDSNVARKTASSPDATDMDVGEMRTANTPVTQQNTPAAQVEATAVTPVTQSEPQTYSATPEVSEQPHEAPVTSLSYKKGEIGGKLSAGEVVLTATGRETTKFPPLKWGKYNTNRTLKQVDNWLMDNAIAEAEARGDEYNLEQFKANRDKPQQADKDSAEYYLFGDKQPEVLRSMFKPFAPSQNINETTQVENDNIEEPTRNVDEQRQIRGYDESVAEELLPTEPEDTSGQGNAGVVLPDESGDYRGEDSGTDESSLSGIREDDGNIESRLPDESESLDREPGDTGESAGARYESAGDTRAPRNFSINEDLGLGEGGKVQKFNDNIEAIRTLKKVESENRAATSQEQKLLAKYVGWGGLVDAFPTQEAKEGWSERAQQLKELLTPEEYNSARASTINAHYTSKQIIDYIYRAMERIGFRGGQVLEPGSGIGNFMGLLPAKYSKKATFTGVELDSITGRMSKLLYPQHNIRVEDFTATEFPNNSFSAVVGNVPFANVNYQYGKEKYPLHDYMILKSLDKLNAGGVMGVITSRYTMDKRDTKFRTEAAKKAELIAAVRLPDNAFKGNAGTEVVTDILFFKKRPEEIAELTDEPSWLKVGITTTKDGDIPINNYFVENPDMVAGELGKTGTMYRADEPNVSLPKGKSLKAELDRIYNNIPELKPTEGRSVAEVAKDLERSREELSKVRVGNVFINDAGLWRKLDDYTSQEVTVRGKPITLESENGKRIKDYMDLRDAVRGLVDAQYDGKSTEQGRDALRAQANRLYDNFVKKYGYFNKEEVKQYGGSERISRPNQAIIEDYDGDVFLVSSIEEYNKSTGKAKKAPLLERDILRQDVVNISNSNDALLTVLNRSGKVDLQEIGNLLGGKTEKEVIAELGNTIFKDPVTKEWQTADAYLSGNVRRKLQQAQEAAAKKPEFKRNVELLKEVQPVDLKPSEISTALGAPWIPADDIAQFVRELLNIQHSSTVNVKFTPSESIWSVDIGQWGVDRTANTVDYGIPELPATKLIAMALSQRQPKIMVTTYDVNGKEKQVPDEVKTIAAKEKLERIKDRFSKWIFEDESRAKRLVDYYNENYNNIRVRKYDGSHLTLPGSSNIINLREHQKNAVWRIMQSGNTLLAHEVGAGKTFTSIAAGMEMKRIGLVKKPAYIVPNHMLMQFSRELLMLYPNAKILVAPKEDFTEAERKTLTARIASQDWDAVILTHSSFTKLPISPAFEKKFTEAELENYREMLVAAKADRNTNATKEIEKSIKRFEEKLKSLKANTKKDRLLFFDNLGIDHIFVDEAHYYKNLGYSTKMGGVKGLPNSNSQRSFDMYMKTQWMREKHGNRGVTFMTATPVSNTMAEMFTMMKYLRPDLLKERAIHHFDNWAATFGSMVHQYEISVDGKKMKLQTRFARFQNLPELMQIYGEFADIQTADMLKLPVPKLKSGKNQIIIAPETEEVRQYTRNIQQRLDDISGRKVQPDKDNVLKVSTESSLAALDMRLVNPDATDYPTSKINNAVDKVYNIWDETKDARSVQLIFSDAGTPSGKGFNIYADIKKKLVKKGVPEAEVAFIHDYDTDQKKDKLFQAVNSGKVRVLLGSTDKMGVGTNVQKKLIALHHLTAPWKPADLQQREGRILRQGNENEEVEIFNYITQGSFDTYRWQTLEAKKAFIDQVMKGDPTIRVMDDIGDGQLSFSEMKSLASGNPLLLELTKIDAELKKLTLLKRAHDDEQYSIKQKVSIELPQVINSGEKLLELTNQDIATAKVPEKFTFTDTADKKHEKREAVNEIIRTAFAKNERDRMMAGSAEPLKAGNYAGFDVYVHSSLGGDDVQLRGKRTYAFSVDSENANIDFSTRIENLVKNLKKEQERLSNQVDAARTQLKSMKARVGVQFDKQEQLDKYLLRQKEIRDQMLSDEKKAQAQITAGASDEVKVDMTALVEPTKAEEEGSFARRDILEIDGNMVVRGGGYMTPDGFIDIHGMPIRLKVVDYVTQKQQEMIEAATNILNRVAGKDVTPVYVEKLLDKRDNEETLGFYSNKAIDGGGIAHFMFVSLSDPNTFWTVSHETIHYLRKIDIFTSAEWKELSRMADKEWIAKYKIEKRYGPSFKNLPENIKKEKFREEAIAEAFADWSAGTLKQEAESLSAFEKLKLFFRQFLKFLNREGITDWRQVFDITERGALKQRSLADREAIALAEMGAFSRKKPEKPSEENGFNSSFSYPEEGIGDILFKNASELLDPKNLIKAARVSRRNALRVLQDKMIGFLDIQREIERSTGKKLTPSEKVYDAEELYTGRVGAKLDKLDRKYKAPLIKKLGEIEAKLREAGSEEKALNLLEGYLYALHAPERNREISSKNERFEEGTGSGMSDEEAQAIRDAVEAHPQAAEIKEAAGIVRTMLDESLKVRLDMKLISKKTYDSLKVTYKHYVPLKGWREIIDTAGESGINRGKGYDVRKNEFKRAFGRKTPAANITANALAISEESIIRGEKNRIALTLYNLVKKHPNEELWGINETEEKPFLNADTGLVEYRTVLVRDRYHPEDSMVVAKLGGKLAYIHLKRPELVKPMRNMDMDNVPAFMNVIGAFTRFIAKTATQWNPGFIITNAARDAITGAINLQQYNVDGLARKAMKYHASVAPLTGSYGGLKGEEKTEWQKWFHDFNEAGGRVAFNRMETIQRRHENLMKEIALLQPGNLNKMKRGAKAFVQFIEDANGAVENSLRVSTYRAARELGVSRDQAASMAKNITVNFNRRGEIGYAMNTLYMFFNAGVQGTATVGKAIARSRRVQIITGGIIMMGFLTDLLNALWGEVDDDDQLKYDKIPEWEKDLNMIVMLPKGPIADMAKKYLPVSKYKGMEYIKIPSPHVYRSFFTLGRNIAATFRGATQPEDAAINFFNSIGNSVNPLGGAQSIINFLAPTLADPVVDIDQNKDWKGEPIRWTSTPRTPPPDSQISKYNTTDTAKWIAETLNSISGGDHVTPGSIDVSPTSIDYMAGFMTGAAGRFVKDTTKAAERLGYKIAGVPVAEEDKLLIKDIPVVNKLVGSTSGFADRRRAQDRIKNIYNIKDRLNRYLENKETSAAVKYRDANKNLLFVDNNGEQVNMINRAKVTEKLLDKISEAKMVVKNSKTLTEAQRKEELDKLFEAERRVVNEFNMLYNKGAGLTEARTRTISLSN